MIVYLISTLTILIATSVLGAETPMQERLRLFTMQENCANHAKDFFYYIYKDNMERQNNEYFSHYNFKLNKCFVLIKTPLSVKNDLFALELYDAVEHKEYGFYWWKQEKGEKYRGLHPPECRVLEKRCSSKGEFDELIRIYMED